MALKASLPSMAALQKQRSNKTNNQKKRKAIAKEWKRSSMQLKLKTVPINRSTRNRSRRSLVEIGQIESVTRSQACSDKKKGPIWKSPVKNATRNGHSTDDQR